MIRRFSALGPLSTLVLATALAACTSPRERLYVLDDSAAGSGAGASAAAPRTYAATVVLGPVNIPPELDRPQIMIVDGDQVAMSEQDRWALPLKQAIPRALAAALTQRTPYRFVPMGSAALESPAARLAIDVARFEVSRSAGAQLSAHWVWRPIAGGSSVIEGDAAAHADLKAAGYAGAVSALHRATTTLAERIAAQLPAPHPRGEGEK